MASELPSLLSILSASFPCFVRWGFPFGLVEKSLRVTEMEKKNSKWEKNKFKSDNGAGSAGMGSLPRIR
jgi:hypothetical protein